MTPPEAPPPGAGSQAEDGPDFDLMEKVAESFVERCQRGERPTIQEYAEKYPGLATQIRAILPTLRLMEEMANPTAGGKSGTTKNAPPAKLAGAGAAGAAPTHLGEYQILREIGRGGMGVVYEAIQETLGRRVALKILPFHSFKEPSRIERFLREARAAARLHHTNIVPVFGVGEEGGTHYYAMQFIRGQGVDQVLRELKRMRVPDNNGASPPEVCPPGFEEDLAASSARCLLSVETADLADAGPERAALAAEAAISDGSSSRLLTGETGAAGAHRSPGVYFRNVARLGLQVAEALAYAHEEGILHRDIKPSNLLLDTQGSVWVTDFGLAKSEGSDELTLTGDLVGTLRYMAPERFKGWSDARSDVYGLGLTLYELVTLKAAFQDSRRSHLIRRILEESPTRPRRIDPQIPRDLETIMLKAIEKEPGRRYGSAGEMAADLRRFLSGEPIRARTVGNVERAYRWCLRNPAWTGLLASVVLLLAAIAAVSTAYSFKLAERSREAQANLRTSYIGEARALRYGGRAGRRFEAIEKIRQAVEMGASPELRDEAVGCLMLQDLRVLREWKEPGRELGLGFDSRVERFAVAPGRGPRGIAIRRVSDGAEVGYLEAGEETRNRMEFIGDDRFLADVHQAEGGHRVLVWDIATGERLFEPAGVLAVESLDALNDPPWLAIGQADGQIVVRDLETRQEVDRISTGVEIKAVALHPEGRLIAVSSRRDGRLLIFDLGSGERIAHRVLPARGTFLSFSPGGQLLAAAGLNLQAYVFETDTWRVQTVLEGHEGSVLTCRFSHQGDFVTTTSWDGTTRLWDAWSGRCFLSTNGNTIGRVSRDDRRQGFTLSRDHWGVWEVANGRELRALGREAGVSLPAGRVDFSPDGRLLAFVTEEGWGLWDVGAWRRVAFSLEGNEHSIIFEPDGGGLIVSGRAGVRRYPITEAGALLRFGPPALLALPGGSGEIALSGDGRLLLAAEDVDRRARLLDRRAGWKETAALSHAGARFADLSPSGRWAATGTWQGNGVKIWDTSDAHQIAELPISSSAIARFSPDERWIATSSAYEYCVWSTDTWLPVRHLPLLGSSGPRFMAFSPDTSLLAIQRNQAHLEVIDPATGDSIVKLELPGLGSATGLGFGPIQYVGFNRDGSLLAAVMRRSILIWDLRLLRDEVRPLGLDWKTAPYPPAPRFDREPLRRVEIDAGPRKASGLRDQWNRAVALGEKLAAVSKRIGESPRDVRLLVQRAYLCEDMGLWKAALADYELCLEIDPTQERALNALAWLLVMAPAELRDPGRAAALASEAVTRSADPHLIENTLGAACYRLGRHDEAVKHFLESSRQSTEAERPYNELFLALSHRRLGNRVLAEWYYRRGVEACDSLREVHRDLRALRAEADETFREESGLGAEAEQSPGAKSESNTH